MRLSNEQQRVLKLMRGGEKWFTAWELKCKITTLQALKSMGLVKDNGGWGQPEVAGQERTKIEWCLSA